MEVRGVGGMEDRSAISERVSFRVVSLLVVCILDTYGDMVPSSKSVLDMSFKLVAGKEEASASSDCGGL
jgi:hypothetical protein